MLKHSPLLCSEPRASARADSPDQTVARPPENRYTKSETAIEGRKLGDNTGGLTVSFRRAHSQLIVILVVAFGSLVPSGRCAAEEDAADSGRIAEILERLERRSDGLKDIRCKVRFVEEDRINLSKRVKIGSILFRMTKPNPQFLIHFERTEVDGIVGKKEWYLFDGTWFYQALERIKQVTKQRIVAEGETVDLFDLERAPFPLPFGQKKETILSNFDVELVPPQSADPPGTDHLMCTPKTDSPTARRYDVLELYVHRDLHLPTRIVVVKNDGYEASTADFPDLSKEAINTGVSERAFEKPSAWKNYKEVVEELVPVERGRP